MSMQGGPRDSEAAEAPLVRGELERMLRELEQMCPYEIEEDIFGWDEFSEAELQACILEEAGQDWAKRRRMYGYVLKFFGGDEGEPRVAAARALLAP